MRGTEEKDQGTIASKSGNSTQVQNFIQRKFKKLRKKKLKSKIFPNKTYNEGSYAKSNKLKIAEQTGITLIALIITIIVMIILAGVSINAVVGDNRNNYKCNRGSKISRYNRYKRTNRISINWKKFRWNIYKR